MSKNASMYYYAGLKYQKISTSRCLHFVLSQWSDFNGYDIASGSEVSNVMVENKAMKT